MGTEIETQRKPFLNKLVLIIPGSLLLLFMILYAIMSLLSPVRKIEDIKNEFGYTKPENLKTDIRIFSDSAYLSLNRKKMFYQAQVIMAETDSICLALNLPDSIATLEISGVIVHKAKISEIAISKVFRRADEYSVSAMLAIPFTIANDFATIKKEPLMLKVAPKDTSEFKPDILPDTTNSQAVNVLFEMENGVRLYLYQNVDKNEGGGFSLSMFDLNDRLRNIGDNIKSIIRLRIPEYHPSIKIRLNKADAKIIYRALPKHGQLAVYL
jgi:hypothetical protein